MLETLKIKNIAVIDHAEVSFKKGLNILSGETGAGKSIVIEAISLILGSRANAELVRAGCDEAQVEGYFDLTDLPWLQKRLVELGFASSLETVGTELLIKRTVHRSGKHRIHVNGELATLALLQKLCEGLVDLCGQHEHQSLTKPAVQLDLLDRYGGLTEPATRVAAAHKRLRTLERERDEMTRAEAERSQRADFLKFQIEELGAAELTEGEDVRLQNEKTLHQTAGSRAQTAESVRQLLEADSASHDGEGLLNSLRAALTRLRALSVLDESTTPLIDGLERALAEAEEVSLALNRYVDSVDLDPARLEAVQERLSQIADLRRKYGAEIPQMLETLNRLEKEFSELDQIGARLEDIGSQIDLARTEFEKLARALSKARHPIARTLSDSVTGEIKDLKMDDARFAVELTPFKDPSAWTADGADEIQFVVQTNRGETARPLGKIASGGELSRLMLSIRRVIADRGGIGVYLFDEIDAGIGGQTAFQVGRKLKSVASHNQVLCITHLPQVAAFADHHLIVRKSPKGTRTITEVIEMTVRERKEELARMLGGPVLTKKSLENAGELLQLAQ